LIELVALIFSTTSTTESFHRALDVFAPHAVVTFGMCKKGGRRQDVTDAERLRYLQRAANHGVDYIDIEARRRARASISAV